MASGEKISVTWIEAALFVFLVVIVMSLVSSLDEVIGSIRESRQPKLDTFNRQAQVPALQLDAVSAQAELTGLQTELAEQQAELVKQAAKVESLREAHPALMAGKDGSAPGPITTSEVTASFDQAQLDYAVTLKFLDELRKRLPQAKATAITKASVLLDALDSAKASFDDAQRTFTRRTRWIVFGTSVGLSLLVLGIAAPIVGLANRRKQLGINRNFVLAAVLISLTLLLAHQTFQMAGAALVSAAIVLIASVMVLRRV